VSEWWAVGRANGQAKKAGESTHALFNLVWLLFQFGLSLTLEYVIKCIALLNYINTLLQYIPLTILM
jgi:hypothetical protein